MAKAYWISIYPNINDPDKVAAYGKLAAPAIVAAGGRFLARDMAAEVFGSGTQAGLLWDDLTLLRNA
ncbi:DUF1330 domain-containing protein [Paraburkholderia sp. J10-1]|uniref:DUF1330 domain-containing protein n=1 Tax=Paraburkholderia sp. J10-1 TaxID=2805430 RepID=UPI002AB789FE|nr:DUF1330 domain-containing protein [Paraburkholderia sp. J10-1]